MNKIFLTVLLTLVFPTVSAVATEETTSTSNECTKDFVLTYFPESIVLETLQKFNIPQDKQAAIVAVLKKKDKEVVKLVEQKAMTIDPNPLKDPQQRQLAVKLFRDTLFDVFVDALKESGVSDHSQVQQMLDDIQQEKAKKFAMCMEKHRANHSHQDSLQDSEYAE